MSRAYLYGLLGFEDEASRFFDLFAAVASRQPEGFVDPEDWVWVYIGVGDWDKVLEYMKLTIAQAENGFRSGDALALANNRDRIPELDQPEFVELRKRLGNPTPDL